MCSVNDFSKHMEYDSMRNESFEAVEQHGASPMNTTTSSSSVSRHDSIVDAPASTLSSCNQYTSFLPQSEINQHPTDSAWQSQRQSPVPHSFLDSQHGTPANWAVSTAPYQSGMTLGSYQLSGIDHVTADMTGSCAIPMASKQASPEVMSEEGPLGSVSSNQFGSFGCFDSTSFGSYTFDHSFRANPPNDFHTPPNSYGQDSGSEPLQMFQRHRNFPKSGLQSAFSLSPDSTGAFSDLPKTSQDHAVHLPSPCSSFSQSFDRPSRPPAQWLPDLPASRPIQIQQMSPNMSVGPHSIDSSSSFTQSGSYTQLGSYRHPRSSTGPASKKQKAYCWDHGCNGREFSTSSNLLRHQREKDGTAAKSQCPDCGAEFTRTTARNGHITNKKCSKLRQTPQLGSFEQSLPPLPDTHEELQPQQDMMEA